MNAGMMEMKKWNEKDGKEEDINRASNGINKLATFQQLIIIPTIIMINDY